MYYKNIKIMLQHLYHMRLNEIVLTLLSTLERHCNIIYCKSYSVTKRQEANVEIGGVFQKNSSHITVATTAVQVSSIV